MLIIVIERKFNHLICTAVLTFLIEYVMYFIKYISDRIVFHSISYVHSYDIRWLNHYVKVTSASS